MNPGRAQDYITAGALAWADVVPVRLQLSLYNLFDKKCINAGHGRLTILNVLGGPRTVLATARLGL